MFEAGLLVAFALHQREPDDRLRAGQNLARFVEVEFVAEANAALGHDSPSISFIPWLIET